MTYDRRRRFLSLYGNFLRLEEVLKPLADSLFVVAPDGYPVAADYHVAAFDARDLVDRYDERSMYSQEPLCGKEFFVIRDGLPGSKLPVAGQAEFQVVALTFEEEYLVDIYFLYLFVAFHIQEMLIAVGAGLGHAAGSARLVDSLHESLEGDRLEEIIDHIEVERIDSEVAISRHDHHLRFYRKCAQQVETVHPRHFDIQEQKVYTIVSQEITCRDGVAELPCNIEVLHPCDIRLQYVAGDGLVFNDETREFHLLLLLIAEVSTA